MQETVAALPGEGHAASCSTWRIEASWASAVNDIGRPLHGVVAAAGVLAPIGTPGPSRPSEFLARSGQPLRHLAGRAHCLPALRAAGGGAIVTFSGGGATAPLPRFDAYAASKAGVVRLTENLAPALAEDGVHDQRDRRPASSPPACRTRCSPPGRSAPARCYHATPQRQVAEGGVPPEAAAELAAFLLSDDARGITGKLISAQWDDWRDAEFRARLAADPDLATLRRIDDQLYRRVQ